MTKTYNHKQIESKWAKTWEDNKLFHSIPESSQDKLYLLFAFPYPSGEGLHVGHVESMTALDILARYYRMAGKDVFFPIGWDAFGLPAENYAVKTGTPPVETTKKAITTFKRQIKSVGISYSWDHELATSHPEYYRWTQWLFLKLYEKDMAYKKPGLVNWCPGCQTVLANEQVVDGLCERSDDPVVQKELDQWYFKITNYKDELISGLDQVDWPKATKDQQINWIGKSKGLSIDFKHKESGETLTVWTKFWETIFGTTFLVIAPEKFESMQLEKYLSPDYKKNVLDYITQSKHKTEEERKVGEKDKTGVDTGLIVINPVDKSEVPLFIADYVLLGVGTSIVMGVPAHDDRDFTFAKKYNLGIKQVVSYKDKTIDKKVSSSEMPFEGEGKLVNSGQFDGQDAWGKGKENMAEWMIKQGFAKWETTYRLRDWLISRQRYWGAPIPIVYDPDGKPHPVKEEHLPWMLPTDVEFKPTGESPLRLSKEFKSRVEKLYGKDWSPEYDTMDTFVDSSWYFLRYPSHSLNSKLETRNSKQNTNSNLEHSTSNLELPFDLQVTKEWLPVDFYMIGPEHIVLHLLYSRFFTKFLRDEGYLGFDEPFLKMRHQGTILGPDHKKMSKSKGNVISPDEVVDKFGADTLRMYEMFMGPIDANKPWDIHGVVGLKRFLEKVWMLSEQEIDKKAEVADLPKFKGEFYNTINKVGKDIQSLKFNTAIASMMEFSNRWNQAKDTAHLLSNEEVGMFIRILAPFAPFMAEELWKHLGEKKSVHLSDWPKVNVASLQSDSVTIVVQVNGKVRATLSIMKQESSIKENIIKLAKTNEKVSKWLEGKEISKTVYIPPVGNKQGLLNVGAS